MLKGLYTIHTGLRNEQNRMDIMTNNLANASTIGLQNVLKSKEAISSPSFTIKVKFRFPKSW